MEYCESRIAYRRALFTMATMPATIIMPAAAEKWTPFSVRPWRHKNSRHFTCSRLHSPSNSIVFETGGATPEEAIALIISRAKESIIMIFNKQGDVMRMLSWATWKILSFISMIRQGRYDHTAIIFYLSIESTMAASNTNEWTYLYWDDEALFFR